jgi:mannose-6-phosphate isomerase-like protein (cupin superfamily)
LRSEFSQIFTLPTIVDQRGNLTFFENGRDLPIKSIERVYFLHGVPADEERGGHAHYELEQMMIAVHGSFRVMLEKNGIKNSVVLSSPDEALIIQPGTWRVLDNFSENSVCMVAASAPYSEADYLRDYDDFVEKTVLGTWV